MTPIRDYKSAHPVAEQLKTAIRSVSPVKNTRDAYWVDVRHWLQFCEKQKVNPSFVSATDKKDRGKRDALLTAVGLWMDAMREEDVASKTRTRRIGTLSSLHSELARRDADLFNPFSVAVGPRREKALREHPTPLVEPKSVARMLQVCKVDSGTDGCRDEALLRLLWATGIRESEAASLVCERLARSNHGPVTYLAEVKGKGGKARKVYIRGRAAGALKEYLGGRNTGIVFLRSNGKAITRRDVWLIVDRRKREAGIKARFSPHSFRASFLTYNGAGLEAKQSAAGHVDASTTAAYDREEWRGKEAFEKMPEVEDMVRDESSDGEE